LPSLNRAALMYLLGVLAVLGMLKREPLSLLCMAFVIQLVVTPQAGLTLSFILSYLALAGILVLGEAVNGIFRGKVPAFLLQPLAASLGAFIATAGVSAWFFGELRPAGIAAGLVLAPLVMLFMAAALAWLGLGFIIPPLSPLLEKPLSFMYLLMEKTAMLAGRIPAITANPMLIISLSLITSALLVWFNSRLRAAAQRLEPFD
ncbi:MAG: ComEC/Rec2 family competence protein, partial [Treponema sp.]|nr:ComEC/Rec2 family competence protein [Treponema sp.]